MDITVYECNQAFVLLLALDRNGMHGPRLWENRVGADALAPAKISTL